jgi:hypothetical protein
LWDNKMVLEKYQRPNDVFQLCLGYRFNPYAKVMVA